MFKFIGDDTSQLIPLLVNQIRPPISPAAYEINLSDHSHPKSGRAGRAVKDVCRVREISDATYYQEVEVRWHGSHRNSLAAHNELPSVLLIWVIRESFRRRTVEVWYSAVIHQMKKRAGL
jgi:hypothetical protein